MYFWKQLASTESIGKIKESISPANRNDISFMTFMQQGCKEISGSLDDSFIRVDKVTWTHKIAPSYDMSDKILDWSGKKPAVV